MLHLFWIVFVSTNSDTTVHAHSVLVVGGGVSGLAAARLLQDATVLEARDRIGGRLHTTTTDTNGAGIDLGGAYLHGTGHELWSYIQSKGISTVETKGTSDNPGGMSAKWRYRNRVLPSTTKAHDRAEDLLDAWMEIVQERVANKQPQTECELNGIAEDAKSELRIRGLVRTDLDEALLRHQIHSTFNDDIALPFQEVSPKGLLNDFDWKECSGSDRIFATGAQSVVDALAKDVEAAGNQILLNQPVRRIRYNDTGCTVETVDRQLFQAAACIVTLPLGVLKAHHRAIFDPPLPAEKQQVLDRAETGIYNTVAVQWDRDLADLGSQVILRDEPGNGKIHSSPLKRGYVTPGQWRTGMNDITQFYVQGNNHDFHNKAYWKNEAVALMTDVFPELNLTTRNIVDITTSSWHTDPYSLGSYSVPSRQSHGNRDRKVLGEPINNVLFFAGEHTNTAGRYQSMDGAYDTGVLAASQIEAARGGEFLSPLFRSGRLQ